ncbi:transporter family-2 protein [Acinetobacter sp. BIGb0102]|uniref:DMT family transporter n=1 Tax=Acinetobacter sp. BIGb0102 TaxID=2485131 RepID=UPI000F4E882D|nr:DMT family transporter [Acinetobacter sp. BIGb0102]RPE47245.1 transporter family-2 protein [Acinetobacter sp. BIGb0102]
MSNISYVFISLLGGAIVPLQLAMVNVFRNTSGASQIQSTFVLYMGGAIASLIIALIVDGGIKPPSYQQVSWWMWLPGFLGSLYILCMFLAAPQIGATNTLLWIFLGQMFFATIIDNTGFLGMQIRKIDGLKLLGLLFILLGGLILIYNEYRHINN